MMTMILIALVLLIAVELVQFSISVTTHRSNAITNLEARKTLFDEIKRIKVERDEWKRAYTEVSSRHWDKTAFAITADGIKALPMGWEKAIVNTLEELQPQAPVS